jgi:hypothetical protein
VRIIEFRGKIIDNPKCYKIGDWAYGDLLHTENGTMIITPHDGSLEWSGIVDEETVGQFTGYYDKKGKKVYEGDIFWIDWKDSRYPPCESPPLKWNEEYGGWIIVGGDPRQDIMNYFEVIDNIHDRLERTSHVLF